MTHKDEDDIGAQVSSRLEELFGEEDDDEPAGQGPGPSRQPGKSKQQGDAVQPGSDDAGEEEDSFLKHLKALVFGIDWEITDDGMKAFLEEIGRLQEQYQNDKVLYTFLKLHESVGKYIRAKKARANPEAFKFIQSVFKSFEKVITNPDMPKSGRKRLLSEQIKNFKDFKQKLAEAKKAGKQKPPAQEEQKAAEKPSEDSEVFYEEPVSLEKESFEAVQAEPEEPIALGEQPSETLERWPEESVTVEEESFETLQIQLEEPAESAKEQPAESGEVWPEEPLTTGQEPLEEPESAQAEDETVETQPAAKEEKIGAVLENQEVIDYIVAELKKTIRDEFHTIRQIIKNLGA
ncbi:MAG: hypothetical protein ACLFNW_09335 [Desulfobacterales bacterium]